ncbi:MAG: IMP dehydrogenase, partial [Candidatus Kariarchaeaceae archaeon]
ASADAQYEFYGNYPDAPEGVTTTVPAKGSVHKVINQLQGGIRSGLSYTGALNITELQFEASFIRVSTAGYIESQAAK